MFQVADSKKHKQVKISCKSIVQVDAQLTQEVTQTRVVDNVVLEDEEILGCGQVAHESLAVLACLEPGEGVLADEQALASQQPHVGSGAAATW